MKIKTVCFTIYFMFNSIFFFAQDTVDGPEGPPTATLGSNLFPIVAFTIITVWLFFLNNVNSNFLKQLKNIN